MADTIKVVDLEMIDAVRLELEYRSVSSLKPSSSNPRKHGKRQLDKLAKKIQEIGFIVPVLIDENNQIIAGHGRILAAKQVGLKEIPTVQASHLTAEQKRAFIIFDNKIVEEAEWDEEMLRAEIDVLINQVGVEIDDTGFTMTEIAKIDPLIVPSDINDIQQRQQEGVGEVNTEFINTLVLFSSQNKWGIPDLRSDLLGDIVPQVPWNRRDPDASPPVDCILTWGEHHREICTPARTKGATLCFYEYDEAFANIWEDPIKCLEKLFDYEWGQIVCPDFTAARDDPLVVQMYRCFQAMWMGRFFQDNGFKVIPTIEMLDERTYDFQWAGIPHSPPLMACQVRTYFGTKTTIQSHQERKAFFSCLNERF